MRTPELSLGRETWLMAFAAGALAVAGCGNGYFTTTQNAHSDVVGHSVRLAQTPTGIRVDAATDRGDLGAWQREDAQAVTYVEGQCGQPQGVDTSDSTNGVLDRNEEFMHYPASQAAACMSKLDASRLP